MRTISATAREQFYKQSSGYSLPILIEITHGVSGYMDPLRLANNSETLNYNGNDYYPYPFIFSFPAILDNGSIQNGKIQICAVDQQIAKIVRSTSTPPTVRAVAMFYYDNGAVTFEPVAAWDFEIANVSGNSEVISADLIYETRLEYEYPVGGFRPIDFPGVF